MRDAIDALVRWQTRHATESAAAVRRSAPAARDEPLSRVVRRAPPRHDPDGTQAQALQGIFATLVKSALAQPAVYVHRDYMPRNLMLTEPNPGVLDFQDAVIGPDHLTTWSRWCATRSSAGMTRACSTGACAIGKRRAPRACRCPAISPSSGAAFEWMGLQRHLKVLGIFARINYRDGKPQYLEDTPRFLRYARAVAERYRELVPLTRLLDEIDA